MSELTPENASKRYDVLKDEFLARVGNQRLTPFSHCLEMRCGDPEALELARRMRGLARIAYSRVDPEDTHTLLPIID